MGYETGNREAGSEIGKMGIQAVSGIGGIEGEGLRREKMKLHGIEIDKFTEGYIECALWSSTDDDGKPIDSTYCAQDIEEDSVKMIVAECAAFQQTYAADLLRAGQPEYNGHDFWLTRNGHGAGFWDRGYGDTGKRLTAASHEAGSRDLIVGDDGQLYQEHG